MFPSNPHAARAAFRELFNAVLSVVLAEMPDGMSPKKRGIKAARTTLEVLEGVESGFESGLVRILRETLDLAPDDLLVTWAQKAVSILGATFTVPEPEPSILLKQEQEVRARERAQELAEKASASPKEPRVMADPLSSEERCSTVVLPSSR